MLTKCFFFFKEITSLLYSKSIYSIQSFDFLSQFKTVSWFNQDIGAWLDTYILADIRWNNKCKNIVTNTNHTYRGYLCIVIYSPCMLKIDMD